MPVATASLNDLRKEVRQVQLRHPSLADDSAFTLWLVHAYVTDDEQVAANTIVGVANDVGVDAIFVDPASKRAFVLQTKYRTTSEPHLENRNDVLGFCDLGREIIAGGAPFQARVDRADVVVRDRLLDVRKQVAKAGYRMCLVYATTGRVSPALQNECKSRIGREFDWMVFGRAETLSLLTDYIDGAAPPVPLLELPVDGHTFLRRFDPELKIESWVFSMRGKDVARIYDEVGIRLFARNIRGFLGRDTPINKSMEGTLRDEPDYFWYYNNGITIVCDSAEDVGGGGERRLRIAHAQIINGQQTTRVIHEVSNTRASVLVRVIAIPRTQGGNGAYEGLVGRIVEATNWQNAIKPSDLMSNDAEQVRLERELRKRSYAYLRKRQSKGEARRLTKFKPIAYIKKDELAQAVAACLLDPFEVREGKEHLFEPAIYGKVFGEHAVNHYLTLYWLGRMVGYSSQRFWRRGYAKWVVLHFLWSQLSDTLRAPSRRETFIKRIEQDWRRGGPLFNWLHKSIEIVFKGADQFYKKNRSVNGDVVDVSNFYKRKGLDERFDAYWKNGPGQYRKKFGAAVQRFEMEINDE